MAAFDEIKDQIIIFFSLRSLFFVHPDARFMNLSEFVPLVNRFWAADTVGQEENSASKIEKNGFAESSRRTEPISESTLLKTSLSLCPVVLSIAM